MRPLKGKIGIKTVFCILPLILLLAYAYRLRSQDVQVIIGQTTLAHGGVLLGTIANSVMTGQLTDVRMNGGQPVAATIKTHGPLSRMEFMEGAVPVAHIRNGTMFWEARGGQVREVSNREPVFRELFFNPSLGIVRTLATAGFVYNRTMTLRGRSVYVLRKSYSTHAPQESSWPGSPEHVDLYIDSATYLIAQVDYTYGSDYNRLSFRYDDYQRINNVAVPLRVSHWYNEQRFWELQLQSVLFNQSLQGRDFVRP